MVRGAVLTAALGCAFLTSCSADSGDPEESRSEHLKDTLCDTKISASALREMYPGPYSEAWMTPSSDGGIKGVGSDKGTTDGHCDVSITQAKGDVYTVARVTVREEPRVSVDELFEYYEERYPDHGRQRLTLGHAKGFTTPAKSVLAFECQSPEAPSSKEIPLGVTVQVLLPDHRQALDVGRAKLAEGAAELAADTARYVSSDVLKCANPELPDGAPDQKSPTPTGS